MPDPSDDTTPITPPRDTAADTTTVMPAKGTGPQHAVSSDAPGISRGGWWVITIAAAVLLIIGFIVAFGPARYWTPVPAVFLGYFLVSGLIGLVFWKGVRELQDSDPNLRTDDPAPTGQRVAAAIGAVVIASALVLLPAGLSSAPANALPCPDGSNTCGPTAPTFDPGPTQGGGTTAPQAPNTTIPPNADTGLPQAPTQGNGGFQGTVQPMPTPDNVDPNSCIFNCGPTQAPQTGQAPPQIGQQQAPQTGQNPVTTAPQTVATTPQAPTSTPKLRTPTLETTTSSKQRDNDDQQRGGDESREKNSGIPPAAAELGAIAGTYRRRKATSSALRDGQVVADDTTTVLRREVVSKPSASSVPPPAPPLGSDNQAVYGSERGIANRFEGATDLRTNGWAAVTYFKGSGKPTAASFLSHYLGNSGTPMTLPASTVDAWTSEATTAYQYPVKGAVDTLRNEALQAALKQAKDAGQTITTSGNTRWFTGVSGNSEDSVTTLGRYGVSVAYSITMDPDGNFSMAWRPDVSDYYNFSPQGDWGDIQHQTSTNMVKLYELGYANEFQVTGSGTVQTLTGTI